jgi:hypothetical protein
MSQERVLKRSREVEDLSTQVEGVSSAPPHRLSNLGKLYHLPVFALRELLESRVSGRKFGHLRQGELMREVDQTPAVTEADVDELYENYRYGRRLSFYLYLLPGGLTKPRTEEFQTALHELADTDRPGLLDVIASGADYEADSSPNQVILLDEEDLNGIHEIRFRYSIVHRFVNVDDELDQVLEARYGFLWLDVDLGYLAILSRDERVNGLLTRALSKCLQAIPLPIRFPREVLDQHFSIEKAKRLAYYDPGTGVRRSISGQGLWQKLEDEIVAREQQYARPGSLYDEEVADGVTSGLGVASRKGKIYLTKTLPTSLVRAWARQRLPDLVRDVKGLRASRPDFFSRSTESINRMRLPAAGKAAITSIVGALLQTEREDLTSLGLSRTALAIYEALAGKYFSPYLRSQCGECDETAELCPYCESPSLDLGEQHVTCRGCGATISDDESVVLRCMNGHVTSVPQEEAFSIAPNHWLQKRMARIFAEIGQSWSKTDDYFHIEGSTLYRLKRGRISTEKLPQLVQNYINNFWDPVSGQIHAGSGDILLGTPALETDVRRSVADMQPRTQEGGSAIKTYKDFSVRIRGSSKTGYTVEAAVSGGGSVPPHPLTLALDQSLRSRLDAVLRQTTSDGDMQALGETLFSALFPTPILKLWAGAVGSLRKGEGLRLVLHTSPPELMDLPWELVFAEEYMGVRLRFPVIRYLDLPEPPLPLAVEPPLRVLVAVSQPADARRINVDAELDSIRTALASLSDKVEMDVLDPARRDELLVNLRKGYHVLHYIGHGMFHTGEGYLILEDSEERSDQASASLLGQIVTDSSLRLVVLNACETSAVGPERAFGGVAQQLVRAGVPAVIAMQRNISDQAARAFSREFYGALADGWPVDAAVQEGRRGILSVQGNDWYKQVDWAIPTLYMRALDGVILSSQEEGSVVGQERTGEGGPAVSHSTQFHGSVYGPAHAGSGDIHVAGSQYGIDAADLSRLFEALLSRVHDQSPSDEREEALQQVKGLQKALEQGPPNLGKMESVLRWFKKNVPQLAGAVASVILSPIVGQVVEAAGELVAAEFKQRFQS